MLEWGKQSLDGLTCLLVSVLAIKLTGVWKEQLADRAFFAALCIDMPTSQADIIAANWCRNAYALLQNLQSHVCLWKSCALQAKWSPRETMCAAICIRHKGAPLSCVS